MRRSRRLTGVALALLATLAANAVAATSAAGTTTSPAEGRWIELKRETPDWYTPELHRKVVAAAEKGKGVPLPRRAREETDSALLFTGIRPGSWMIFPSWCTMNFVFGSESAPYIGTAGHCTDPGDEVTIVAAPGVLMNIGTTVVSVNNGVGDDFAAIQVHPEMAELVNPSMAMIAGPTGAENPGFGDVIEHVGHGLGIGTGGTPRAGLVTFVGEVHAPDAYCWMGAINLGDSGSGARNALGAAAGNVTHIFVGGATLPAWNCGTTIGRMLQLAPAGLATASLVPDPLP
ncbi:MAG TPA: hypothetical protein VHJ82_07995 [Actinomycetota bacterium]|nr:hypothetical protein [Actinomycetota bacterium]